jgi:hypothetical protein
MSSDVVPVSSQDTTITNGSTPHHTGTPHLWFLVTRALYERIPQILPRGQALDFFPTKLEQAAASSSSRQQCFVEFLLVVLRVLQQLPVTINWRLCGRTTQAHLMLSKHEDGKRP